MRNLVLILLAAWVLVMTPVAAYGLHNAIRTATHCPVAANTRHCPVPLDK